jgi:hypothetical protein
MSVLVGGCEKFLYDLKAGPAGGRLRRPPSAGSTTTVVPTLSRTLKGRWPPCVDSVIVNQR